MYERVVVISPTREEIAPFAESGPGDGVTVVVAGVGMAETAEAVRRALAELSPSMIILAGIAGRYSGSVLKAGDAALVERECVADLGAMREDGFEPLFRKDYICPFAAAIDGFPKAVANTVSAAAAPFANLPHTTRPHPQADLENMEGAAFFAMCLGAGIPFLELRCISNTVGDAPAEWNIPLATANLAGALGRLLQAIAK